MTKTKTTTRTRAWDLRVGDVLCDRSGVRLPISSLTVDPWTQGADNSGRMVRIITTVGAINPCPLNAFVTIMGDRPTDLMD